MMTLSLQNRVTFPDSQAARRETAPAALSDSRLAPSAGPADSSGWEIAPATAMLQRISSIPANHPVMALRSAAQQVFEALDELIERGSRAPASIGFCAAHREAVKIDAVIDAINRSLRVTRPVITAVATDGLAMQLQEAAKEFHQALLGMRLYLLQPDFQDGIAEPMLPEVVSNAISYHRGMANALNMFTGFSIGIVQVQDEHNGADS